MTQAAVQEIDGQLVLIDPTAVEVIKAVGQHNCKNTLKLNEERVRYFAERAKKYPPGHVVIVVINMDDPMGAVIGDALMPNYDWNAIRAQGQVPFARGLAERFGIAEILAEYDMAALAKMENIDHAIPVVVIDHGVFAIFSSNGTAVSRKRCAHCSAPKRTAKRRQHRYCLKCSAAVEG